MYFFPCSNCAVAQRQPASIRTIERSVFFIGIVFKVLLGVVVWENRIYWFPYYLAKIQQRNERALFISKKYRARVIYVMGN